MLEVTAYTGLGPGPHDVVVTGLTRKTAQAGGEYLRWEFSDRDGKTTSANSAIEMTPGNKTGKWFATLTGRPTVVGERRDPQEVIGKPCSIFLELNSEGFTKVVGLTARVAKMPSHKPAAETVNAASAAEQHAIQEGEAVVADDLPF